MALNKKQMKCIEYMVYTNLSNIQIGKEIGITNATISAWMHKEEFVEELQAEVKRKFQKMAVKATRKLDALINSKNEQVSLKACVETLNKSGYKEVEKIESTNTVINVDVEE